MTRAEPCPIMEPRWDVVEEVLDVPQLMSPQHQHLSVSLLHLRVMFSGGQIKGKACMKEAAAAFSSASLLQH